MMFREEISVRYDEGVTPIWSTLNKSESNEKAKKKTDQKADKDHGTFEWTMRMIALLLEQAVLSNFAWIQCPCCFEEET